jgi:hypothetical protein
MRREPEEGKGHKRRRGVVVVVVVVVAVRKHTRARHPHTHKKGVSIRTHTDAADREVSFFHPCFFSLPQDEGREEM